MSLKFEKLPPFSKYKKDLLLTTLLIYITEKNLLLSFSLNFPPSWLLRAIYAV